MIFSKYGSHTKYLHRVKSKIPMWKIYIAFYQILTYLIFRYFCIKLISSKRIEFKKIHTRIKLKVTLKITKGVK